MTTTAKPQKKSSNEITKDAYHLQIQFDEMLEKSGGEITPEMDEIIEKIEQVNESAEQKTLSLRQVVFSLTSFVEGVEARAEHYKQRATEISRKADTLKNKIDYLESLATNLVNTLPDRGFQTPEGDKIYIQDYKSLDDSEISDEEKELLVTRARIGKLDVKYKVLKKDLEQAIKDLKEDAENFEEETKHILSKIRFKTTSKLRGF